MQDKLVRVQFEVSREKLEELDDWMRVSQSQDMRWGVFLSVARLWR